MPIGSVETLRRRLRAEQALGNVVPAADINERTEACLRAEIEAAQLDAELHAIARVAELFQGRGTWTITGNELAAMIRGLIPEGVKPLRAMAGTSALVDLRSVG